MKELHIFRIFALFPLIGILIPDLATVFNASIAALSTEHVIVNGTLLLCVAICSIAIYLGENNNSLETA
jgi:hypothetical protein